MSSVISVVMPSGSQSSTCGYCGSPGSRSETASSYSTGLVAMQLSCEVYQKMIDRGWRRSGTYCYKPDLRRSCCPQYTIKLDALEFKPSKSQRKLVNRWNRFILDADGKQDREGMAVDNLSQSSNKKGRTSSKKPHEFSLISSIHESEHSFSADKQPAHNFQVILEPASYSEEKYALYSAYQADIHLDEKNTPQGFKGFLVTSTLRDVPIPYSTTPAEHLPHHYGSYHQLYRLDGELIAMGVLDILPGCVSSVYFMYHKKWEMFSLGKLSALREVALAREIHEAGVPGMSSLYMGFYIHSCQKMRYKGDYSPSYLLDPEEYTWHPLTSCLPLLEKKRYACFAHPENSLQEDPGSDTGPTTPQVPLLELRQMRAISEIRGNQVEVIPIYESKQWQDGSERHVLLGTISALGVSLSKGVIFYLDDD